MVRAGYGAGIGLVMAVLFAPLLLVIAELLPVLFWYLVGVGVLMALTVALWGLISLLEWWTGVHRRRAKQLRLVGMGELSTPVQGSLPLQMGADFEPSIGKQTHTAQAQQAWSPSGSNKIADRRFALIDKNGRRRYPQIIKGTFQVGKGRDELPGDLVDFARAILKQGKGGRFMTEDGSSHGILGYGGRAREAVAYELDPAIAAAIGASPKDRL